MVTDTRDSLTTIARILTELKFVQSAGSPLCWAHVSLRCPFKPRTVFQLRTLYQCPVSRAAASRSFRDRVLRQSCDSITRGEDKLSATGLSCK
jgi:hypothetical protein